MPLAEEGTRLTILLGTAIILLFGVAIVALFVVFQKKGQLSLKEKEIMKGIYEKMILQSQLEIQEQTFSDISGELHDNVGQVLSLAKVQINIMNESDDLNKEMLNGVKENIGKAMTDLRDIAKGLSSERICALGIYETVAQELDRMNKTGMFKVNLSQDGREHPLDDQRKLILFRMIQECLQNCIKHADASEIGVAFHYEMHGLKVCVRDNGKGFDADGTAGLRDGLGFMNLQRRAFLAGGEALVQSVLNEGTTVNIRIPYE
jgi:two-component system, NarL family, sensor kinase